MGDLCCYLGPRDIWACVAAKVHVWVHGSTTAGSVFDVCGLCYYWGHRRAGPSDLGTGELVLPLASHLGKTAAPFPPEVAPVPWV